jgi:hypothetical protein
MVNRSRRIVCANAKVYDDDHITGGKTKRDPGEKCHHRTMMHICVSDKVGRLLRGLSYLECLLVLINLVYLMMFICSWVVYYESIKQG